MERVRGARRPRLRFIERFHNSPALAETAPFPSSNAQEDVAQIRRIRLLPPLLPLAVKVQYHAAQQRHRCKSEDQQQAPLRHGQRGRPKILDVKCERLRQLSEPREHLEAVPRLRDGEDRCDGQSDRQGEELRAEDRPADAVHRGFAAAKLRSPP